MSWQVYGAYARACGVPAVLTFLVTVALSEGSRNFSDAWLARWSGSDGKISSEQGIELYALAALICLVTGVVYSTTRVLVGQRGCLGEIRAKSIEIPRNPIDLGKRSRHFEAFRVNFSRDEVPGAAREVLECAAARAHELLRLDAQRSDPEPPGRGVFTRLLEGVSRRFKTFRALRSDSEDTNILDYNLPQTPLGLGSRARLD